MKTKMIKYTYDDSSLSDSIHPQLNPALRALWQLVCDWYECHSKDGRRTENSISFLPCDETATPPPELQILLAAGVVKTRDEQ